MAQANYTTSCNPAWNIRNACTHTPSWPLQVTTMSLSGKESMIMVFPREWSRYVALLEREAEAWCSMERGARACGVLWKAGVKMSN